MSRNPDSMHAPPRVQTRRLGDFTLHALEAGTQRLDGGAMFGVVPKPLWEKRIPADERNRIPLGLRCLLVETADQLVLIETGLGNKENDKFRDIYGVDNASSDPRYPDRLQQLIAEAGFRAEDVGVVIDTHLHFDHAGGNTFRDAEGQVRVSFPNARYHVQRGEWEWAHRTSERTSASYLPDNYVPVMEAGQLELVDGDVEIVPGISVMRTPGHCPHHQSVLVRSGGQTACFLADVIPTFAHLPLPWIMGYDVEPLVTLESKRALLRRATDERWLLVSTHDPFTAWGYAAADGKGVRLEE
ncbi:MBL fold metallo-hydrolase [Longimicrobium sp.]|uniref:MBL fold metallo-hydrolase n=1 Tax=Longimicrobium sp. TaxID=2029185 RepID=UPI003B3AC9BC